MLNRLLPEQVSRYWDIIKPAVEVALPPVVLKNPSTMNNILTASLCGKIDVWVSYTRGEQNKLNGIALTKLLLDDVTNTKNLLIYTLYGDNIESDSWLEGLNGIAKYAKSIGCLQIVAYSNIPYVVKLADKLGADTSYTFISFDINKIIK